MESKQATMESKQESNKKRGLDEFSWEELEHEMKRRRELGLHPTVTSCQPQQQQQQQQLVTNTSFPTTSQNTAAEMHYRPAPPGDIYSVAALPATHNGTNDLHRQYATAAGSPFGYGTWTHQQYPYPYPAPYNDGYGPLLLPIPSPTRDFVRPALPPQWAAHDPSSGTAAPTLLNQKAPPPPTQTSPGHYGFVRPTLPQIWKEATHDPTSGTAAPTLLNQKAPPPPTSLFEPKNDFVRPALPQQWAAHDARSGTTAPTLINQKAHRPPPPPVAAAAAATASMTAPKRLCQPTTTTTTTRPHPNHDEPLIKTVVPSADRPAVVETKPAAATAATAIIARSIKSPKNAKVTPPTVGKPTQTMIAGNNKANKKKSDSPVVIDLTEQTEEQASPVPRIQTSVAAAATTKTLLQDDKVDEPTTEASKGKQKQQQQSSAAATLPATATNKTTTVPAAAAYAPVAVAAPRTGAPQDVVSDHNVPAALSGNQQEQSKENPSERWKGTAYARFRAIAEKIKMKKKNPGSAISVNNNVPANVLANRKHNLQQQQHPNQNPKKKRKELVGKKQNARNGFKGGVPPPKILPDPGRVSSDLNWYCCLNNDTVTSIAEKLGIKDCKMISKLPENISRYGTIPAKAQLRKNTLLLIPTELCSKWKLQGLQKELQCEQEWDENETCVDCGKATEEDLILCDGCDSQHHLKCVGLPWVPDKDWFCRNCTQILLARKNHVASPSLIPTLPPLGSSILQTNQQHTLKLHQLLLARQQTEYSNLAELYSTSRDAWEARKNRLSLQIEAERTELDVVCAEANKAQKEAMEKHGIRGWSLKGNNYLDYILLSDNDKITLRNESVYYGGPTSKKWNDARRRVTAVCSSEPTRGLLKRKKDLTEQLKRTRQSLVEESEQQRLFDASESQHRMQISLQYAPLLGQPILPGERQAAFRRREAAPRLMGTVFLGDQGDVVAMNMLREPDELIFTVPLAESEEQEMEPRQNASYAVFARAALFDKERDDKLPWKGVREAQRRLYNLLVENNNNRDMVVRLMSIPDTVRLRKNPKPSLFDVTELINDCNVDLDLPQEPTPAILAKHGLKLRDYQQSSLRWMLDKEQEAGQLGIAGEFWQRLRFLDDTNLDYYFCDLTNSFALTLSDPTDMQQSDAAPDRFCLPSGGYLAEEMGLGKTVITLALIVSNPPPLHRRVLPREHIWDNKKGVVIYNPDYVPLPVLQKKDMLLSNGTLVIVPETLLSQWETEINRWAPHMKVMALHTAESATVRTVATCDIVLASTSLLSQFTTNSPRKRLLLMMKKIHFHRICVDEAQLLSQSNVTRSVLASLSGTFKHSISGTPIGTECSDLYSQLFYLRVAPFHRPAFWKNLMEDPYHNHNVDALEAMQGLLSRLVVRHSKSQTSANGNSLEALPPRTVQTILLPFGTDDEKTVYNSLETRNRKHFLELKRMSNATILTKYFELMGLLSCVRQACSHPSLVSLERVDQFNRMLEQRNMLSWKPQQVSKQSNQTREGIVQLAASRARPSARDKMRRVINQFLYAEGDQAANELLECPVCLEIVDYKEVALPACAHPVCSSCMGNLLGAATSRREATGACPTCRDKMYHSEITYLGDVTVDEESPKEDRKSDAPDDTKPNAVVTQVTTTNGFQMKAEEVHTYTAGTEASSMRVSHRAITEAELQAQLHEDRAALYTLDEELLRGFYAGERKMGTKMAHLLKEIQQMIEKSPESKCVVFSLYDGFLDLVGKELTARGIGHVCITGSGMKQYERADALLAFNSNQQTKVLLLNMRSGAVGLTLTVADHCFVLDVAPCAALEEQAIDRIHRIGQTRPVTVKRLLMEGTVEERLLRVRRSLAVDELDQTRANLAKQRNNTPSSSDRDDVLGKQQQRINMLEELYDCSNIKVHMA